MRGNQPLCATTSVSADRSNSLYPFAIAVRKRSRTIFAKGIGAASPSAASSISRTSFSPSGNLNPAGENFSRAA